jgi:SGNH domain (fused to AT3 domains)
MLAVPLFALAAVPGTPNQVKPGSPHQVKQAVAASHTITTVGKEAAAQMSTGDYTAAEYPATVYGCTTATQCVFGDTKSRKTVVLFGDSHALMWLPAMDSVAKTDQFRLVLLWKGDCSVANVVNPPTQNCPTFRTASIKVINSLHPVAVVLGEKTTGTDITSAMWQAGLTQSIKKIKSKSVVMEDPVFFNDAIFDCLAANPTSVQKCATPAPNPAYPGQQAAEQAAAKATHSTYIKTWQWFCTTTCSPIVAGMAVYSDHEHVTASYSTYLSDDLKIALSKVL